MPWLVLHVMCWRERGTRGRERERGDGLKEEKRQGRVRGVERVQKAVHREEEGERERERRGGKAKGEGEREKGEGEGWREC